MPVELLEAVASSGELPERTPPRLGTLVHLRRCKSLIYKHSIIILIFQGTQRKAYKNICLMLAAGIEPVRTKQAKKGATCTPLDLFICFVFLFFQQFPEPKRS